VIHLNKCMVLEPTCLRCSGSSQVLLIRMFLLFKGSPWRQFLFTAFPVSRSGRRCGLVVHQPFFFFVCQQHVLLALKFQLLSVSPLRSFSSTASANFNKWPLSLISVSTAKSRSLFWQLAGSSGGHPSRSRHRYLAPSLSTAFPISNTFPPPLF
jgi:hypothetical protein